MALAIVITALSSIVVTIVVSIIVTVSCSHDILQVFKTRQGIDSYVLPDLYRVSGGL